MRAVLVIYGRLFAARGFMGMRPRSEVFSCGGSLVAGIGKWELLEAVLRLIGFMGGILGREENFAFLRSQLLGQLTQADGYE